MSIYTTTELACLRVWGTPRVLELPLIDRASLVEVKLIRAASGGENALDFYKAAMTLILSTATPWLLAAPQSSVLDGYITCIFNGKDGSRLETLFTLASTLGLEMLPPKAAVCYNSVSNAIEFSTSVKLGSTPAWLALETGDFVHLPQILPSQAWVARFGARAKGNVLDFTV